jgi:hypothetical protein
MSPPPGRVSHSKLRRSLASHKHHKPSTKGLSFPLVFLLCLTVFVTGLQLKLSVSTLSPGCPFSPPDAPVRVSATAASFIPCQAALSYFTQESLEEAIQKARDFHLRGGNLKSIQLFKDRSLDDTLERLGLQFIPNGRKKPAKEVSAYLRQYYDGHFDPRGGYRRPLPGAYSNENHKMLYEKRFVDVVEPFEGRLKWDAGIGPIGPACSLVRFGPPGTDGSKYMCKEMDAAAAPAAGTNAHCDVLSVGGNDNWQFETAVREKMGCATHSFDCTLPMGKPRHKPNDDNVNFFNNCIDGESHQDAHGRQYLSYHDMLEKANITEAPKLFKLDVEGFEYDIFTQMISNEKRSHLLPQQISVELHWATRMTGQSWMPRSRTSAEIAMLMGMMFTAGGYLPVYTEFEPHCTSCLEVTFFRAVCYH